MTAEGITEKMDAMRNNQLMPVCCEILLPLTTVTATPANNPASTAAAAALAACSHTLQTC
jgi:hypothetical protein